MSMSRLRLHAHEQDSHSALLAQVHALLHYMQLMQLMRFTVCACAMERVLASPLQIIGVLSVTDHRCQ